MPDDIGERIKRLEDEVADLKAVHGAEEDLRKDAEAEPYGLTRLRRVKRKETYPSQKEDDE